ncbi:MAG: transglycosylase SLT domain-containing protein [Myxococcales bacterium]|nr:transglycosylase SLT domain-containing protein [Myxococcales bacterium]MCB9508273.1 transglycosylase SLT domain-containing protein [Myxococcales bacterium]
MSENTNLMLIAALGAGGLWLYHDREKHRHAARQVREELGLAAVAPVRPVSLPARTPEARAQRIKLAPRSYDALFAEYGNGIPVAYLRALAWRESGMNPRENRGPAWGLLQVVEVVRKDYNARHGTRYERRDLLDPAVNVAIASDVLARIVDGYARFHPEATNLQADWTNPLFVELLTFGWNAGFSERGGVGRVASYLTQRGFDDFTIDDVTAAAKQAGVSPHLANPRKVAFSKGVTTQYLRERARDEANAAQPEPNGVTAATPASDEPVSQPSQVDGTEAAS